MVKKKAARKPMKKAKKAKPARRKAKRSKKARPSKGKKKPLLGKKALTKGQLIRYIASDLNLTKGDVSSVMDGLVNAIDTHLAKNGPQEFTIPGVLKLRVVRKPPVKAREGINPFTGQPMMFPAKPARNVVKVRVLKRLKELVK
jgi:nucleoid DNA-binding protein